MRKLNSRVVGRTGQAAWRSRRPIFALWKSKTDENQNLNSNQNNVNQRSTDVNKPTKQTANRILTMQRWTHGCALHAGTVRILTWIARQTLNNHAFRPSRSCICSPEHSFHCNCQSLQEGNTTTKQKGKEWITALTSADTCTRIWSHVLRALDWCCTSSWATINSSTRRGAWVKANDQEERKKEQESRREWQNIRNQIERRGKQKQEDISKSVLPWFRFCYQ